MHNSSLSSASSSTDSWDFDSDLIIPDGPLTLLQLDSENNTEDSSVSSSIHFAPISSNVAYSTLTTTTTTTNLNYSNSSQSVRPRTDDSEQTFINLVILNLRMKMRFRMRNKVEEAEDDIKEGFFDDIEFASEFGIPNNFHQTSKPSNPLSSLPSSKLHKPTESVHSSSSDSSRIVESKSKNYLELQRSVTLQTYLQMKACTQALMAKRGSYSFPSEHYHQPKSSSTQSFVTAPIISSSSSSTSIAAPSSGPQIQPPSSSTSSSLL
ncbi:hypothetical protein PPACK8108_LOCUS8101 [Phakopsora pachyrhizi]|uniref:Uncharacterized protein n=1 Tax=Phakopsora pachyrhizi TaxID=170000 RepID=A0AAV0AVX4_PHAPC|nr:hypothetical protein PPACK8108_LOCUS8101 [Phakopsora pachyrhizi]